MPSNNSLEAMINEMIATGIGANGGSVIASIRNRLIKDPELIEQIVPGKKLVDRKMTPVERSKIATKAASELRSQEAEKRDQTVLPILREAIAANPAISLRELAAILNKSGIYPLRAKSWSPVVVNNILLRSEIFREPSEN
ncbi:hypothetical protein [Phyllobacterium myrsinacearum]|uniref:Recombinase domain-containing protein n=1 Tax=Phyllobacterium myrsinacearum TaxID=28101 RepID=A0A839EU71_9HYPH|nr:hypothetical protein [Phyllobacterium myrsinacearum]MBA8881655.1 hypothetical protein [Phyllobacterium myrsinacearum]